MFLAYNDLIPSVSGDNYETKKRKYLNDISREAPKFLAYIEIYNIRDDTQMTQRKWCRN